MFLGSTTGITTTTTWTTTTTTPMTTTTTIFLGCDSIEINLVSWHFWFYMGKTSAKFVKYFPLSDITSWGIIGWWGHEDCFQAVEDLFLQADISSEGYLAIQTVLFLAACVCLSVAVSVSACWYRPHIQGHSNIWGRLFQVIFIF